jgi:hypothetical protein
MLEALIRSNGNKSAEQLASMGVYIHQNTKSYPEVKAMEKIFSFQL